MNDVLAGPSRLAARHAALVDSGALAGDPAQFALIRRFDALNRRLAERRLASKGSALGWLFAGKAAEPIKGIYVHGEVGRGKTMLMDEFFAVAAPVRKRRTHFHEFMAEVHERIQAWREAARNGAAKSGDPIVPVATKIAEETRLLCLDEFMVTDIADAMILSRLFGELFAHGLVLVATSNSPPDDLYRDGLNRALFLPFLALLKREVDIVYLRARTDYRLEKLGRAPVYVTPLGQDAQQALDRIWRSLTSSDRGAPAALDNKGRQIRIPQAAKGVARLAFADLCEAPLGAGDYSMIARAFHTVLIDNVPVISDEQQNAVRRFINLIDIFYDHGVKLVIAAAAEPEALYRASAGEEAFAFRRTVSRLIEMRSEAYLAAPRGAAVGAG